MFLLAALLAARTACGDLCTSEAVDYYARLNALAALNRRESERAAFLVRRGERLNTVSWQAGQADSATYRGRIPTGTLAVIHTHPLVSPNPSAADVSEARRLKMPVVVITPASVVAAMPDGQVVTLFGAGWNGRGRGGEERLSDP